MEAIQRRAVLIGSAIGIAITPAAIFLAVLSGGAGHGHYVFARLLFPVPMLLTKLTGDTISFPSIALALAQLPLYGFFAGRRRRGMFLIALVAHVVAAALCFRGMLPNFS